MSVILWLSGDTWSAAETGQRLEPLLRWLFPWVTPAQIAALHALLRKLGHPTEYGILALLWLRALGREAIPARRAGWLALGISVFWAVVDETHQSFVPSRTASPIDVGIDGAGAAVAIGLARGDWRRAVDRVTTVLLWFTTIGGIVMIIVNAWAGVHAIALWITTPAAVTWLVARRRQARRARARIRRAG